ncbi:MAG: hypothetical protein ACC662_05475 [Planctomycetota bacterium]
MAAAPCIGFSDDLGDSPPPWQRETVAPRDFPALRGPRGAVLLGPIPRQETRRMTHTRDEVRLTSLAACAG